MTRGGEAGYSLIEVLVAFTILAGAVIMGFRIFGDGLRRIGDVGSRIASLNEARLILETFAPVRPGVFEVATADGRELHVAIQPVVGNPEGWALIRPYRAQITESADRDAKPLLETVLFGAAAP